MFGGPGLDAAGAGFEKIGLTPGKQMATVAEVTNLAAAAALAAAGPGRFRLGPPLPRPLTVLTAVVGGALAAGSLAKLLTAPPPAVAQPATGAAEAGTGTVDKNYGAPPAQQKLPQDTMDKG